MNLSTNDTIAIVIDIQSKLVPFIADAESLRNNNIRLIKGLRELEIPIIVTEQYPRGLGTTDEQIQTALSDDYRPIIKDTFSCVRNEEFLKALNSFGKKNIIVVGIEAHICVMQTVIDLVSSGYNPIVAADCISSRSLNDKKYAIKRMIKENAWIGTYESMLMELTVGSYNPKFKAISSIIK